MTFMEVIFASGLPGILLAVVLVWWLGLLD